MRVEEGWEGRMNIVERGGALQGRMGAARLAQRQNRAEQIVEGGFTFEVQQVIIEDLHGGFVVRGIFWGYD
jgi:hypothetical protein